MAQGYYETALRASEEIIQSGNYALYQELEDPSENFANLFLDKSSNSEMIFVKDYLENGRTHGFTFEVMPRSLREDNTSGGKLNPSLNLVQTFELLDNTFEPLRSEEHTSELQSRGHLVCRLLLEKKKTIRYQGV